MTNIFGLCAASFCQVFDNCHQSEQVSLSAYQESADLRNQIARQTIILDLQRRQMIDLNS